METEKKTLRKWILLILVLLIPITAVLVALRISQAASREKEMNRLKMEMVSELLNNAEDRRKVATDWFLENIEVNLSLMAVALQEFLTEDGYEGPRSFEDGVVIEVRDNEILYPDDKPANCPEVTMEMLKDGLYKEASTSTVVDLRSDDGDESSDDEPEDNRVSINFAEIGNGFYYVDWTRVQEYEEYIGRYTETEDLLAAVEKALNIGILVVDTDTKDLKLLSPSGFFPNAVCAAELGITHEDLNAEGSLIRIGGRLFHCSYQTLPHLGKNLIYLSPFTATVLHSIGTAMMTVTVILLLLVTVGTWILSVRRYVRRTDISRDMETLDMYRPRRLRIRALAAGLTGTVVIFLFALIFQSLSAMQSETENARETINVLFNQLQERERQQIQKSKDLETDWFVYYGQRLASLIGEYPQVGTPENLDYYCLMTGADYIMLFDTKGQETVCSDGFTGLKLDSAFGENSADFMKLLNGVTSVVHEPAVDSLTGLTRQIVGVCLPQEKGYGALIMSIQPGWTQRLDMDEDLNTRLAILTPKGRQCFAAEKEGGLIRYASTDSMIGSTVENCGLSADTLRDSYTDFVTLNNVRSYAVTTEMDPLICYCSTETRYLFSQIWAYAIVSALASALALLATTRFLLKDYTDTQFEEGLGYVLEGSEKVAALGRSRSGAENRHHLPLVAFPADADLCGLCLVSLKDHFLREFHSPVYPERKLDAGLQPVRSLQHPDSVRRRLSLYVRAPLFPETDLQLHGAPRRDHLPSARQRDAVRRSHRGGLFLLQLPWLFARRYRRLGGRDCAGGNPRGEGHGHRHVRRHLHRPGGPVPGRRHCLHRGLPRGCKRDRHTLGQDPGARRGYPHFQQFRDPECHQQVPLHVHLLC